jgi:uncharacterized protein YaaN involved in tellurite resistance
METDTMSEPTQKAEAPTLLLEPPELLQPIAPAKAPDMVPLDPGTRQKVDQQVDRFIDALLGEPNVETDGFKSKVDAAFRLGREEISSAANLMTGRFMERNFVGLEDSAAFKAIQDMRGHLDELNPGKEGDLLSANKVLGMIPWGNKLQAYFRKFQSAGSQLKTAMQQVYAARDDMQRDAIEIENVKAKLWESMQKLEGAVYFAQELDRKLAEKVAALKGSDPTRGRALEQEVLFYARQNLQDMLTQQAVNVNGYLSLDVLKKTAREMINGCNRVATTGMSALATAQTVARATGNQIEVMQMLQGLSGTIGDLVSETSRQLGQHVEKTGEFASNPLLGIEKLKESFDNTFRAMDAMDNFRSKAIEVMGRNNELMRDQLKRSEDYLDKVRGRQAREAAKGIGIEGPVKL